ncbi:MAG TPA: hypothetical protein VHA74_00325 [Candidatus Dojkabacteria bacterium]|nr:hypothetical protein [Candidatus Dojkabacteria bacterium]
MLNTKFISYHLVGLVVSDTKGIKTSNLKLRPIPTLNPKDNPALVVFSPVLLFVSFLTSITTPAPPEKLVEVVVSVYRPHNSWTELG